MVEVRPRHVLTRRYDLSKAFNRAKSAVVLEDEDVRELCEARERHRDELLAAVCGDCPAHACCMSYDAPRVLLSVSQARHVRRSAAATAKAAIGDTQAPARESRAVLAPLAARARRGRW